MDSWRSLNRSNTSNSPLELLLVLALLFAIFHVSQHDLDADSGHLQDNCQVCRLAHLQGAELPTVTMITPLFICLGLLVVSAIPLSSSCRIYAWHARAPPSL